MDFEFGSPEQDDIYFPQADKRKRKSAKGRELIRWDPAKDQLVLLCVDYVCAIEGVPIPWDKIAELLGNLLGKQKVTGEALKQHLAKVYKFRVEYDQLVPPKLDRTQRRKAVTAVSGTAGTPAPTRTRGKKVANKDDDDEKEVPVTPVKPPGAGLLHLKVDPKKKAKTQIATPKTPGAGRGGGRKKRTDVEAITTTEMKDEDEDGDFGAAPKKKAAAPRGNKRARKSKSNPFADGEEEDLGIDVTTPTKKPKDDGYLRALPAKNYSELAQDEDDADAAFAEDNVLLKQQSHSSQGSNVYQQRLPFGNPAQADYFQDNTQAATPAYTYQRSGEGTPYGASPHVLGYNPYQYPKRPPPQMQMLMSINGYNYGTDASVPRRYDSVYNVGNTSNFEHPGVKYVSQAQMLDGMNALASSHTTPPVQYQQNIFNSAMSNQATRRNSFGHDDGMVNKIEESLQQSDKHYPLADIHVNNTNNIVNAGGTTSSPSLVINPPSTGITPYMVQTGFKPLPPLHTDSFDSNFDSSSDDLPNTANVKTEDSHGGLDFGDEPQFDNFHFRDDGVSLQGGYD